MIPHKIQRFGHLLTHPSEMLAYIVYRTPYLWSDKFFIKTAFHDSLGYSLNLESPQSFNEKLQWLKLYNRDPKYTVMVDKVKAKEYVASIIGNEYIIPTLGVWENPDDIDFSQLPDRFVLKCNHNSGLGMYICKDKSRMDIAKVKDGLREGLRQDYFINNREWPYKNVLRRILAEQYLEPDSETNDLRDYKFFCFNGRVKCFKVDYDRHVDHHANYYDPEGNLLPFGEKDYPPQFDKEIKFPVTINKMISLAEVISKGHIFMRVDFYDHNGRIYFGEITFFPASGKGRFDPEEWDYKLGEWLSLPLKKQKYE